MADRRISELSVIPAVAGDDALAIVDTSLSETNKVSVEDLLRSAPAGTAAAPSIAFVDDPDTGFYRSAANELSISTNGSQRVVVGSTGRIGIGTSNPGSLLEIRSTSPVIRLRDSDATNTPFGELSGSNGNLSFLADRGNVGTGGAHVFYSQGTNERMRITSAGNVGIGTSSPGRELHVVGASNVIRAESTGAAARIEFENLNSSASDSVSLGSVTDDMQFVAGSTERMRIKSDGVINFASCPTYADDTAAGTGGLAAGDVYKTSTGELRIKL